MTWQQMGKASLSFLEVYTIPSFGERTQPNFYVDGSCLYSL